MSKVKEFFAKIGRWFKSLFVAITPDTEPKLKTLWKKQGTRNFA